MLETLGVSKKTKLHVLLLLCMLRKPVVLVYVEYHSNVAQASPTRYQF